MNKKIRHAGLALLAATAFAACSDGPSPAEPFSDQVSQEQPFFSVAPAPGFDIMDRTVPLGTNMSVEAAIYESGGTMSIPAAGIYVVFPKGAVSEPTKMMLTAFAGDRVAFEFYPHGLTFNVPVQIHLDVERTEAEYLLKTLGQSPSAVLMPDFLGVYWEGNPDKGPVTPVENFPVYYQNARLFFGTTHFSGYAIAW